ncbi:N-alpha-acetyltransferase 30 [Ambystoma mexicanum]|uniref:N-alpha-acetyltransferase 30 n=1 Tax=Ambystoma mexicanum TaxID=8296 RepID=UPI0037E955BE
MTAELPPGPSVLPTAFPGPEEGPGASWRGPEDGEAECSAKGPHRHHHHHPPNGLIGPELRHLRPTRSKGRAPKPEPGCHGTESAGALAVNGLEGALAACSLRGPRIRYVRYESELQMPEIMRLITKDLSEPYSIYTYRYFIHNWPQLCFLAMVGEECVGAIVCKLDMHKKMFRRGYIAMLAVDSKYRRNGIGTNLVKKAIYAMVEGDCDEVVLETEITNKSALKLYENLGFVRDKRLFRYYLNGVDALRLKLWLR